jgi:hypothetical protein
MPVGLFLVLVVVVVLVLVIEKIELVKPVAKRIEDDMPARGVSPAKYLQFLTTCCQKNALKGLMQIKEIEMRGLKILFLLLLMNIATVASYADEETAAEDKKLKDEFEFSLVHTTGNT